MVVGSGISITRRLRRHEHTDGQTEAIGHALDRSLYVLQAERERQIRTNRTLRLKPVSTNGCFWRRSLVGAETCHTTVFQREQQSSVRVERVAGVARVRRKTGRDAIT